MERIRPIARVVVVLCLVLTTQSYLTVRLLFEVRQGYIAQVLCENRDRPEMQCEGSCFLSERLAEEQRRKDQERRTAAFELIFSSFPMPVFAERFTVTDTPPADYTRPSNVYAPEGPVVAPLLPPPRVA